VTAPFIGFDCGCQLDQLKFSFEEPIAANIEARMVRRLQS